MRRYWRSRPRSGPSRTSWRAARPRGSTRTSVTKNPRQFPAGGCLFQTNFTLIRRSWIEVAVDTDAARPVVHVLGHVDACWLGAVGRQVDEGTRGLTKRGGLQV